MVKKRDPGIGLRAIFAVTLICALVLAWGYHMGYRINRTVSHPLGLYRIVDREPAIGLYALFCVPARFDDLPPPGRPQVPPCTRDSSGYPVLKRIIRIDADAGAWYVRGDHPRSLDSRIFGPLTREDITDVAVAVWIW